MDFRKALDEPVSDYAWPAVQVEHTATVTEAAKAMKAHGATEALVTSSGRPLGMVTERDILFKVVAEGLAADDTNVGRVMTSPVETIDADAKVGDALAMMAKLGVRRLPVTKGGKIVGMVTQKSVMGDRPSGQVLLPELSKPGQVTCPYCGAVMADTKELSKHIDQAHVGAGLLEGNKSSW